jgi:hypothetical protein
VSVKTLIHGKEIPSLPMRRDCGVEEKHEN